MEGEEEATAEVEGDAEACSEESAPGAPAVGGEEAAATAAAAAALGGLKRRLEGGRVGKGIKPPLTVWAVHGTWEEGARVGLALVLQLAFIIVGLEALSGTAGDDENVVEVTGKANEACAWCGGPLAPRAALVVLLLLTTIRERRDSVASFLRPPRIAPAVDAGCIVLFFAVVPVWWCVLNECGSQQ